MKKMKIINFKTSVIKNNNNFTTNYKFDNNNNKITHTTNTNFKNATISHFKSKRDNKLKEMKNRLEHLQSKIGNIDRHFDSQFNYSNSKPSINSAKQNKKKRHAKNYSASKRGRSCQEKLNANTLNNEIWKEKFMKLKDEFNKDKNFLIKLRTKKNELSKKLEQLEKRNLIMMNYLTLIKNL